MSLPVTLHALDRYLAAGTFTLRSLDCITLPPLSYSTRRIIKFSNNINVPDLPGTLLLFRQAVESQVMDDQGVASRDRVVKLREDSNEVRQFRLALRQFAETFTGVINFNLLFYTEKNDAIRETAMMEIDTIRGFILPDRGSAPELGNL